MVPVVNRNQSCPLYSNLRFIDYFSTTPQMFRLEGSELFIQTVQSKTRLNLKKYAMYVHSPFTKSIP